MRCSIAFYSYVGKFLAVAELDYKFKLMGPTPNRVKITTGVRGGGLFPPSTPILT